MRCGLHMHYSVTGRRALTIITAIITVIAVLTGMAITMTPVNADDDGEPGKLPDADTSVHSGRPPLLRANDITIHDELDDGNATITNMSVVETTTGTSPFNDTEGVGNDVAANDDVVRSFDEMSYDVGYSVSPKSEMDYYKKARVGFRFELPMDPIMGKIDQASMGWIDLTPGYEADYHVEDRGGTKVQVLTAYRRLESTEKNPHVAPSSSTVPLIIKVRAATNGFMIKPTVSSWVVSNEQEKTDLALKPVKVTAAPRYDVKLADMTRIGAGEYDFGSNSAGPNSSLGNVNGVLTSINVALDVRNKDTKYGLKGVEAPSGPITFDIHMKDRYTSEDGSRDLPYDKTWQPVLWGWSGIGANGTPKFNGRNIPLQSAKMAGSTGGMGPGTSAGSRNVYDSGDWNITTTSKNGELVAHVTVDNYKFDYDKLPTKFAFGSQDTSELYSNGQYLVGEFATQSIGFVAPSVSRSGVTITAHYREPVRLSYKSDDRNLKMSSITGQAIPPSAGNDNQMVTNNDNVENTIIMYPTGSFSQVKAYTCRNSFYESGTDCGPWWTNYVDGKDAIMPGEPIHMGDFAMIAGDTTVLPVSELHTVKFDPSVVDVSPERSKIKIFRQSWVTGVDPDYISADDPHFKIYWLTKPNGKTWASDDEQRKTKYNELKYWNSKAEAEAHGVVVGAAYTNNLIWNAKWATNRSEQFWGYEGKVKDNARIGSVAQLTGDTIIFTRGQLRAKTGLAANASDEAWQAAADRLPGPLELAKEITPLSDDGSVYTKAKYDNDGEYIGGDTSGNRRGDSLHIVGENTKVKTAVADRAINGDVKSVYDLDNDERTAKWSMESHVTSTMDNGRKTQVTMTITIPSGLKYRTGSMYVGSTKVNPTVVSNADGSDTLTVKYDQLRDDSPVKVTLLTDIGDRADPQADLANNTELVVTAEVVSTLDHRPRGTSNGNQSSATIRVSKTRSYNIGARATPIVSDMGRDVTFKNVMGNFGNEGIHNAGAVAIMPNGGYSGDWSMQSMKVAGRGGASLNGAKIHYTNDPKWANVDPKDIPREEVAKWPTLPVAADGTVTWPNGSKPTAWALTTPGLNPGESYSVDYGIRPNGSKPGDTYSIKWSDWKNTVQATSQVADRTVTGTVWYDENKNGVLDDGEQGLKSAKVSLVDQSGNVGTNMLGVRMSTTTGSDGKYTFMNVPSGMWTVKFNEPATGDWSSSRLSPVNVAGTDREHDSDATSTSGKPDGSIIKLDNMPVPSAMTSARYIDSGENLGLYGSVPVDSVKTSIGKTLINGQYHPGNPEWVVTTTPLTPGAPTVPDVRVKSGETVDLPTVTFTEPGEYKYRVAERNDNARNIEYDGSTFTVTHNVTRNGTRLSVVKTIVNDSDGSIVPAVSFKNTYEPDPAVIDISMGKKLIGRNSPAGEFTFNLLDNDGNVLSTKQSPALSDGVDGTITFNGVRFDRQTLDGMVASGSATRNGTGTGTKWTVPVFVRERPVNSANVTPDSPQVKLTLTVWIDGYSLKASQSQGKMKNTYRPDDVIVSMNGVKRLVNRTPWTGHPDIIGKYTFKIKAAPGTPMPTHTSITNGAGGLVDFGQIKYTKDDLDGAMSRTFTYTVTEHGSIEGVDNDQASKVVKVTVVDDGLGKLRADLEPAADPVTGLFSFTNEYSSKPVSAPVTVEKSMVGRQMRSDDSFSFSFHQESGPTESVIPDVTIDGTDGAKSKTVTRSALFDRAGEYVYTVREVKGSAGGVTYDPVSWTFKVKVTDENGRLSQKTTWTRNDSAHDKATFKNTYDAKPVSVSFNGVKHMVNDTPNVPMPSMAGRFKFTITGDGPLPSNTTASNDQDGKVVFGDVKYVKSDLDGADSKTFKYIINEEGVVPGVSNDATPSRTVTVVLSDDGVGGLHTVVSTIDGNGALFEFTNQFAASPTDATASVSKLMVGRNMRNGEEYVFNVHDEQGSAWSLRVGGLVDGVPGVVSKTFHYDTPGVYRYTVTEERGQSDDVKYDDHTWTWTVNVSLGDDGALHANQEWRSDDGRVNDGMAMFTNTVKTGNTTNGGGIDIGIGSGGSSGADPGDGDPGRPLASTGAGLAASCLAALLLLASCVTVLMVRRNINKA